MSGIVCLYFGDPRECPECGGFNDTGHRYCSHDCGDSATRREAESLRRDEQRRAREEAFALAGSRLADAGYTDEQIDLMLAGLPS